MNRHSLHNSVTVIEHGQDSFAVTFWRGEKPIDNRYPTSRDGADRAAALLQSLYGTAEVYEAAHDPQPTV